MYILYVIHVTYFPTNLVYPFTLRVTGLKMSITSQYWENSSLRFRQFSGWRSIFYLFDFAIVKFLTSKKIQEIRHALTLPASAKYLSFSRQRYILLQRVEWEHFRKCIYLVELDIRPMYVDGAWSARPLTSLRGVFVWYQKFLLYHCRRYNNFSQKFATQWKSFPTP